MCPLRLRLEETNTLVTFNTIIRHRCNPLRKVKLEYLIYIQRVDYILLLTAVQMCRLSLDIFAYVGKRIY